MAVSMILLALPAPAWAQLRPSSTPTLTKTSTPTRTPKPPPRVGCCDGYRSGKCVSPISEQLCAEGGGTFIADAQCDVRTGRCVVPTATPTRTHTRTPVSRPPERGCCERFETEMVALCLTGIPIEGCRGVFVPGGTCNEQGRCVMPTPTPTPTKTSP